MELYSNKGKIYSGVFEYNNIPEKLRQQLYLIIVSDKYKLHQFYSIEKIYSDITEEYGVESLYGVTYLNKDDIHNLFMNMSDIELLDFLELILNDCTDINKKHIALALETGKQMVMCSGGEIYNIEDAQKIIHDCINKVNIRFKENGYGYMYNEQTNNIEKIPILSELNEISHELITNMTNKSEFEYAYEELDKAKEFYRKSDNENCISTVTKALESVLKVICINLKYTSDNTKTCKYYFDILSKQNYYSTYAYDYCNNIVNNMNTIAIARNKNASHGQGVTKHSNDDEFTEYIMYAIINICNYLIKIYYKKK